MRDDCRLVLSWVSHLTKDKERRTLDFSVCRKSDPDTQGLFSHLRTHGRIIQPFKSNIFL
jgi:hypothetical protein